MSENTLTQTHHQEVYRSTKTFTSSTTTTYHQQSHISKDTVDRYFENGSLKDKFESLKVSVNGQGSSATTVKEFSSSSETKSFIQQRVERLYGPGALAQGFFVTKRQKSRTDSESERDKSLKEDKSFENGDSPMKQSNSSPALPVFRHLRPEFRAQLPVISPRKSVECSMQKSSTVPELKGEAKINGHSKQLQVTASEGDSIAQSTIAEESGEKDGHHFLRILQNETQRLLNLADQVESELNNDGLSEDVIGKIRSASGKARLLVSQKMQQFKGLCTNNITQGEGEAFPTTNEDLQGFWDMVMLQVDQVDALFREIGALKANNWQEVKPVHTNKINVNGKAKKIVNRTRPTSAAAEEARKQREAQRKQMIEERRKAMKAQSKPVENIEIFVPESS